MIEEFSSGKNQMLCFSYLPSHKKTTRIYDWELSTIIDWLIVFALVPYSKCLTHIKYKKKSVKIKQSNKTRKSRYKGWTVWRTVKFDYYLKKRLRWMERDISPDTGRLRFTQTIVSRFIWYAEKFEHLLARAFGIKVVIIPIGHFCVFI